MYCPDTNILISFFRGDQETVNRMNLIEQQTISTSPIILAELYKGAYAASRQVEALTEIEEFLVRAEVLEFDEHAARIFGQRYNELKKLGKQTQELDLMIASICIAHNAKLITRNGKDFKNIRGLQFEQW